MAATCSGPCRRGAGASLWASVVTSLVLLARAHAQGFDSPPPCTTPDKQPGTCVVLQTCPPVFALLKGGQPLAPHVLEFLRKSHCGFQGNDPKVCCPGLDPTQPRPPNPRPTSRPTPRPTRPVPRPPRPGGQGQGQGDDPTDPKGVNVAREPNLRLLPHDVCGPSAINRIINGNKTAVFEFPWMARLGYKSTREVVDARISREHNGEGLIDARSGSGNGNIAYRCGGSLINARYVLTAAHCVEGIKSTEILSTVRLGENDVSMDIDCSIISGTRVCAPPVVDVGVEQTVAHPDFSMDGPNRLQNDIALVRMERRVAFTDAVRPICLPVGEEQYKELDNKKVIVAGWGTTESGYSSTELLQVHVPVVKGTQCADVYKSMLTISPAKQMCAGGTREGDSCNGDSGGPLKYAGMGINGDLRTLQFGIVSFGPRKCGSQGMPGVYTRVGYYMQWILRNLRP